MLQAPSHATRVVQGGHTYVIPSSHASPGQPFSITLGKRGKIEVSYEKRTEKPVISVSHISSSPRREERSHESTSRHSKSPRSDVATLASSTYMHSGSSRAQASHSGHHPEHREHKTSPSRHAHHDLPSSSKSPYVASNGLLTVPGATNGTYERQRRHSSAHAEGGGSRPIAIPQRPVAASPEKHAHFALPHSAPDKYALPERVSASPRQPSRHHHSHSQDSYFREAPRGWYNRRGDQFIQKGLIRRQPDHLQWHRVFDSYPEPGQGWMNEEKQILPYHGGILSHK